MKAVKLSLAAALVASSAFAIDNVKVSGDLKAWYQTAESSTTGAAKLFDSQASAGDFVAKVGVTGNLTKKVGFGLTMYGASTLGLENNLVAAEAVTAGNTGGGLNGNTNNPVWMGEAYFTYSAAKTIAKIGRQELDTPLAYTEKWNAAPNTFEATVLVNQDLPDTVLVGAYVSRGNGAYAGTVASSFSSYGNTQSVGNMNSGAYAIGAINSSISNLTLAGWYYNVMDLAKAYNLEATYNAGVATVSAMYANVQADGATDTFAKGLGVTDRTTDAFAAKVSGEVSGIKLAAAYSNVSSGLIYVGNTATNGRTTKIYTAGVGGSTTGTIAGAPDTTGYKVSAETAVAGINLGLAYNSFEMGKNTGAVFGGVSNTIAGGLTNYMGITPKANGKLSPSSIEAIASTKIDEVNLLAAYIHENEINYSAGKTVDQDVVRIVANIGF